MEIHITRSGIGGVYGHPVTRCDAGGCAAVTEMYYADLVPSQLMAGDIVERIDDDPTEAAAGPTPCVNCGSPACEEPGRCFTRACERCNRYLEDGKCPACGPYLSSAADSGWTREEGEDPMLTINEKDWEDVTNPGQVPMYCAMIDAEVCGQRIRMAAFAIQVTIDDGDGSQNPDGDDPDCEWFNRLLALAGPEDGPYQTVTIKGKPCVVWVEPTCE